MCGHLFYRFIPDAIRPTRAPRQYSNEPSIQAARFIREVFIEAGGTIKVNNLCERMLSKHGTTERYVRTILTVRTEFVSTGKGWWRLDLDNAIFKSDKS